MACSQPQELDLKQDWAVPAYTASLEPVLLLCAELSQGKSGSEVKRKKFIVIVHAKLLLYLSNTFSYLVQVYEQPHNSGGRNLGHEQIYGRCSVNVCSFSYTELKWLTWW